MAQTAKKDSYAYAPSRVYSYSRAATAEALPAEAPVPERARPSAPQTPHPAPRTRVKKEPSPTAKRKQRFLPKLMSFVGIFLAAAVLIFIVVRYSMIAEEYNGINSLKSEMEESRRRIAELQVKLDSAVDMEQARETASLAGFDYPTAEQIVDVDGVIGGYAKTSPGGD